MRRGARACAALLAATLMLTACNDGSAKADAPVIDGETSSPSAEKSVDAAAGKDSIDRGVAVTTRKKPVAGKFLLRENPAKTAEEETVIEVWYQFWDEVMRMYNEADPDPDRMYELSSGKAAEGPLDYANTLQDNKRHETGGLIAEVRTLKVSPKRAVVVSCMKNSSVMANKSGKRLEPLTPYYMFREILKKEGPDWRVHRTIVKSELPC